MRLFTSALLLVLINPTVALAAASDDLITARVAAVADGDSITVLTPGESPVVIRLHGIDCPETGQPFGESAKQFTSSQCFGKIVLYRIVGIDILERTIATVFLEDGRELNLEILRAGLAWHAERYADRQDYAEAEEVARNTGVGLWSQTDPTPPWQWRREHGRDVP